MDTPKFTTAAQVYTYICETLDLVSRSINFHIISPADEFGGGLIDNWEDLNDDDAFNAVADRMCDEPLVYIESVDSYNIGRGESDNASWKDLEVLENVYTVAPDLFNDCIYIFADHLFSLRDSNVANPCYDEDALDEE